MGVHFRATRPRQFREVRPGPVPHPSLLAALDGVHLPEAQADMLRLFGEPLTFFGTETKTGQSLAARGYRRKDLAHRLGSG